MSCSHILSEKGTTFYSRYLTRKLIASSLDQSFNSHGDQMFLRLLTFSFIFCFYIGQPLKANSNGWVQTYKTKFIQNLLMDAQIADAKSILVETENRFVSNKSAILEIKKESTQLLHAKLDQILSSPLKLKPYPEEPDLLVSLKADLVTLANKISELDALLVANDSVLDTDLPGLKDMQELLAGVFVELNETVLKETELKSLLELFDGSEIISHPDLIKFIDDTVEPWGAMEILTQLRREELLNYVAINSEVVRGRYGDFEQVPQGQAYLLWSQDKNEFYDLKDFKLENFSLPVFRPIKVSYKFENQLSLSNETLTHLDPFPGSSWSSKKKNNFENCIDHKSLSVAPDPESLCELLFQDEALLNLDLAKLDKSTGYIISAEAAEKISGTFNNFLDDAKTILANKYPKSFADTFQSLIKNQLAEIKKKADALRAKASKTTLQLEDLHAAKTESELIKSNLENELKKYENEEITLGKRVDQETVRFNRELASVDEFNNDLKLSQNVSVHKIEANIEAIENDIEAQFEEQSALLEKAYLKAKTDFENLQSSYKTSENELKKLEQKLPVHLAQQYVDDNLQLGVSIKNTVLPALKRVCFSLKLNGKYFLTKPTSINLLFKGTTIPAHTESVFFAKDYSFLGMQAPLDLALFQNKYRERVIGIAPNLVGYENKAHCSDVFKKFSGKTSRFFEKMNGGAFDPRNWSVKIYGAKLGYEDDIDISNTTRGRQRYTSQKELFKNDVADLKKSAIAEFKKYQQFRERLIDFSNASDIKFLQSFLKQKGYSDVSLDGAWGPRSNSALADIAAQGGVKYLEPKDWTLQMQRLLLVP